METASSSELMEEIEKTRFFELEKKLLNQIDGVVAIMVDYPKDLGAKWSIRILRASDRSKEILWKIADKLGLSWDKEMERWYIVGQEQKDLILERLVDSGFVVYQSLAALEMV